MLAREEREPQIQVGKIDFRVLRFTLAQLYDLRGLNVLAFDLALDSDEILGETKTERIVELPRIMRRTNRLEELLDVVNKDHPRLLEVNYQPPPDN